jgi:hypothetical protein
MSPEQHAAAIRCTGLITVWLDKFILASASRRPSRRRDRLLDSSQDFERLLHARLVERRIEEHVVVATGTV